MTAITVYSANPPGGRCKLYQCYADEICAALGLRQNVVYTAERCAHGDGFPSFKLGEVILQPSDGVILSPEDICAALARAGLLPETGTELLGRLNAHLDALLEG
jgi:cystathionine gamma-synthase